jgi:hypothetical protein
MLSSTRASALAFSLAHRALPAESSKQGLLRAIAQQRAAAYTTTASASVKSNLAVAAGQERELHRRRNGSTYATAAAFAEEDRSDRIDHEYVGWRTRTANRRFPDPRPPDLVRTELATEEQQGGMDSRAGRGTVPDLPSMKNLREMMKVDPIQALRLFPHYPISDLSTLTSTNLIAMLKELYKQAPNEPHIKPLNRDNTTFQQPLVILRALLYDLPSTHKADDKHLGKRFRTDSTLDTPRKAGSSKNSWDQNR